MDLTITIDVRVNEKEFDLWVSDDVGGSGISVFGNSTSEVIENLTPYIESYLTMAQSDTSEDLVDDATYEE
jgi:hypothetical protein